jgi:tetratricopeptide (TPR) repeat protein
MKKAFWAFVGLLTIFFAACATTGSGGTAPAPYQAPQTVMPETDAVFEGDGVSLAEAIEQSAEKIAADLPAGSRVAIVAWESPSLGFSDYIMEELTGALVDRDMEVADRQNLEYVYKELNFQMSGEVSDESARSIGKFLGADLVITGQLMELGGPYRYRANAVNVETATRDSVTRLDVRGDAALRRMAAALANQKPAVKTASYGESGKAAPKTAGTFLDRGILFGSRGDFDLAIEDFTEAIKLDPNMAAAYLQRSKALLAGVSMVSDLDENFEFIIWDSGIYSEKPRDVLDRALADAVAAIKLAPDLASSYRNRGRIYNDMREYDKAVTDSNQAIKLDPNYALAYYDRGFAYHSKGDSDRAIADYSQAIKLNPNYAAAYNYRGMAYHEKGDYDRAIADYTAALRIDPDLADAYIYRGLVYHHSKSDYDRAIADYTQVIKIDPDSASAYNVRGYAYNAKGDYKRARADWEQVLRLDPNDAEARDNLETLRKMGY